VLPPDGASLLGGNAGGARVVKKVSVVSARNSKEKIGGANRALRIEPQLEQPGRYNFLLGADPSRWHKEVRGYVPVTYRDAWRGVDLRLYGRAATSSTCSW
jgi:hypothetical protein